MEFSEARRHGRKPQSTDTRISLFLPVMIDPRSGGFRAVIAFAKGLARMGRDIRVLSLRASDAALSEAMRTCPVERFRRLEFEPAGYMMSDYLLHSATSDARKWLKSVRTESTQGEILLVFGDFPTGVFTWARRTRAFTKTVAYSWGLPALYPHFRAATEILRSRRLLVMMLRVASPIIDKRYFEIAEADAVIPISPWLGHFLSICLGIKCARAISPPIDTEYFRPAEEGPLTSTPYALAVGSPTDLDFSTIADIATSIPIVKAGRGTISNCRNIGFVESDASLRNLYTHAQFLINSPRLEPFGLIPLESMACGTPVISIGYPGADDHIPDPPLGAVAYSTDELARKANQLWLQGTSPELRVRVREYVERLFSVSVCARNLAEFLDGLQSS